MVPVAAGELIDKITILKLKVEKLTTTKSINNAKHELNELEYIMKSTQELNQEQVYLSMGKLEDINRDLWEVEDKLRVLEREELFEQDFIDLARSVYKLNDERSKIKKVINIHCKSVIIEEKSYGDLD